MRIVTVGQSLGRSSVMIVDHLVHASELAHLSTFLLRSSSKNTSARIVDYHLPHEVLASRLQDFTRHVFRKNFATDRD